MKLLLKKGDTKKEMQNIEKKLQKKDWRKYKKILWCNNLKGDPLSIQQQMRDEWK